MVDLATAAARQRSGVLDGLVGLLECGGELCGSGGERVVPIVDVYGLGVVCREALGGDVPDELAPVLDAAVATNPADRPASASELARLLRAAVPGERVRLPGPAITTATDSGRVIGPSTRLFGPRPPARAIAKRRRSSLPLLLVPLVLLAGAGWLRSRPTSNRPDSVDVACAGAPMPVPAGGQVVRADVAGIGCLASGVYADEVLTIRLEPTDPMPRRFALGRPGDRLYLGDWNCDGIATPALFRPSTGASLYYDTWSTNEKPSNNATRCRSIK
jgi:hypothetical protein